MSNARFILVILVCAAPVILVCDGPIVHGLIAGVAAAGMLILARSMRPGETAFFLSVARPVALFAAVPALWMVIQVLPLGVLAHPIWASASAAIRRPMIGAISIDIGASVVALGQYLTLVAIGLWSAAVAADRQRAEWILFSLMLATAVIAAELAAGDLFGLAGFNSNTASLERAQAIDSAAMGIVIAAAAAIRTLDVSFQ